MAIFPLLAEPDAYRACESDLRLDTDARAYWIDLFESNFGGHLDAAAAMGVGPSTLEDARAGMQREIDRVRVDPACHGRLDILTLDRRRRAVLDAAGLDDVFRDIKARENRVALGILPTHLARLDVLATDKRLEAIVRAMLAGNLFDLGAKATATRYAEGALAFDQALASVPRRPWRFDELDDAELRFWERPPRRVVLFADNAGSDAVLGLLPLARHFVRSGAAAVIAANSRPSLNDVTAPEMQELLERATGIDPIFGTPAFEVVGSGGAAPLIDLAAVSPELAAAAADADLVVLVGMGRAVESNWSARFSCDCLRVAMVKDPQVAKGIGAELFDAVVRFA